VQLHANAGGQYLCKESNSIERFTDPRKLLKKPDILLSVGGDGTFLEAAMLVRELGIPIAGINTGRLGFLANISVEEIPSAIEQLIAGEFSVITRSLLEVINPAGLFGDVPQSALNEITIQKADLNMITINVYIDGLFMNTYWADGLIISTATGSTAYNLSAGGPILSPGDESFIISPISPHNLTIRPVVVSGKSRLKLSVEGRSCEFLATCDFRFIKVPYSQEIEIARSEHTLKSVLLNGRDFYSTLRSKLMWGADKRN
jgi:NAD+ kinase